MDHIGQPTPRHQYVLYPQPGRRGILMHAGQYANGAPYVGSLGGAYGAGYGMGMGYGVASYPGVHCTQAHIAPLYYGPNVAGSTYSNYASYLGGGYMGFSNIPANCYTYPSHSYISPYAFGYGTEVHANHFYPYQRTYYGATPVMGYPATQTTVIPPSTTTTYTVTNSHAAPMTTTTTRVQPNPQHGPTLRSYAQHENTRVAMQRGAYNPRPIKPADARPDDPFWCRERSGEWHLRTFYQIENECHPGNWAMDPERGCLVFHRF